MKLDKFDNISSDLKIFDETSLRVYQEHTLWMNVSNNSNRERFDNHKILNIVMIEINMILNFFWLNVTNSNIDWFSRKFEWRFIDKVICRKNDIVDSLFMNENNSLISILYESREKCNLILTLDIDIKSKNFEVSKNREKFENENWSFKSSLIHTIDSNEKNSNLFFRIFKIAKNYNWNKFRRFFFTFRAI